VWIWKVNPMVGNEPPSHALLKIPIFRREYPMHFGQWAANVVKVDHVDKSDQRGTDT
jgi:hypothetical protein